MTEMTMHPMTRGLIHQQRSYATQAYQGENLTADLAGRILTLGVTLLIHAELVRRVVNLCFLTILHTFSQSHLKELNQERVQCFTAFTMWREFFAALFKKNMLIKPFDAPTIEIVVEESEGIHQRPKPALQNKAPESAPAPVFAAAAPSVAIEEERKKPELIIELVPERGDSAESENQVPPAPVSAATSRPPSPKRSTSPQSPASSGWNIVSPAEGAPAATAAPPAATAPSQGGWGWFNRFWGSGAPAAEAPAAPQDPVAEENESVIRKQLEDERGAVQKQFDSETVPSFHLTDGPSTLAEPSKMIRCIRNHKVIDGFKIGMCQSGVESEPLDSTQFAEAFELKTESGTHDVFVAGNIEALKGSKAAIYLKNHFVPTLSRLLHQHNLDELSVKGTRNALHLVFSELRKLYRSDFGDTPHMNDQAFGTIALVLDGAIWTANLGKGGAILVNVNPKDRQSEQFIQQLALHNSPEAECFGALSDCTPRIFTTPIGKSRHLIFAGSALIEFGSVRGIGREVRKNQEQLLETLAYNLVFTGLSGSKHQKVSCMIIEMPDHVQIGSSTNGSRLHLETPSEPSVDELSSAKDLAYSTGHHPQESGEIDMDAVLKEMEEELKPQPPTPISPPIQPAAAPSAPKPTPIAVYDSPLSPASEENSPPFRPRGDESAAARLAARMARSPDSDKLSPPVVVDLDRLSEGWHDVEAEQPKRRTPSPVVVHPSPPISPEGSDFELVPPITGLSNSNLQ